MSSLMRPKLKTNMKFPRIGTTLMTDHDRVRSKGEATGQDRVRDEDRQNGPILEIQVMSLKDR